MPRVDAPSNGLTKRIGLWSAVAVVIGSTIGSGIFRTPASISEYLPGPGPMLLVWLAGALIALCGALTLAEVGGAYPQTGGLYVYIREAFGRMPAFLFGWSQMLLIRSSGQAAVAVVFSEYALRVMGQYNPDGENPLAPWLAGGAILAVGIFNHMGIKTGALVQNLTVVGKLAGLLFVTVMALSIGLSSSGGHFTPFIPTGSWNTAAFGLALISVLWAYDGWSDMGYVAGEVENPRRNVPLGIVIGTGVVAFVYLLANVGYLSVLSVGEIARSPLVAADTAQVLVGTVGVSLVAITVMVSTFGTLNGSMITTPRIFFAMAQDGLFFEKLSKVHPRYESPYRAVWFTTVVSLAFIILVGNFSTLTDAFVTASVPFYALAVGSVFLLRKKQGYDSPVRTPLYPVLPILFLVAMGFILVNALFEPTSRGLTLIVLGIVAAGVPVYYATKLHRTG